jgi:hypothetical protein
MSGKYDDLLPVSLHKAHDGDYHLLDRHNDEIAIFSPAMEIEDMQRIVDLINENGPRISPRPA